MVVKNGLSRLAEQCLSQQTFDNFFPRIQNDNGNDVDLLPGYGFVKFDPYCDRWEPINSTRGVKHLLPLGHESPSTIPSDFIDRVKALLLVPETLPPEIEVEQVYQKNDIVDIVSGPMTGHVGTYHMRRNRGWAEVVVAPFGIEMKAIVKFHQLRLKGRVALAA